MTDAKGLRLVHEHGLAIDVHHADTRLLRYVYEPWDAQFEAPRPYLHPIRTLGGDLVSLYRPHDHVWHKGLALSLPNVGAANFWGGPTYLREHEYIQLPNDGSMRHRAFDRVSVDDDAARIDHTLDWVTEPGQTWFREQRSLRVTVEPDAWILVFGTRFTNVSDEEIVIGSPTTQGRENAGYGGLFWRGPRSFTGGTVYAPGHSGGDDLMGLRAPWMGLSGKHDEHGGASTVVMVDAPGNGDQPTQWFVRSTPFACLCPAPFFSTEVPVAPGGEVALRYAMVVADGDDGLEGAARLADLGAAQLSLMEDVA